MTRGCNATSHIYMKNGLESQWGFSESYTRRGLWPQAAFWVLCLFCNMQIVAFSEIYPQQAQQAGGIKVCQVDYVHLEANLGNN